MRLGASTDVNEEEVPAEHRDEVLVCGFHLEPPVVDQPIFADDEVGGRRSRAARVSRSIGGHERPVVEGERRTAIELKYLADRFDGFVQGEPFALPRQGAHDISRYDACKDIWRLETMVAEGYADCGSAIVLSNDGGYWRPGTKPDPIDACFRIYEGRTVEGALQWAPNAGAGTTRSRLDPLPLRGSYPCRWTPYSHLDRADGRRIEFRYLHHLIVGAQRESTSPPPAQS